MDVLTVLLLAVTAPDPPPVVSDPPPLAAEAVPDPPPVLRGVISRPFVPLPRHPSGVGPITNVRNRGVVDGGLSWTAGTRTGRTATGALGAVRLGATSFPGCVGPA